jgi:hypothetical protein
MNHITQEQAASLAVSIAVNLSTSDFMSALCNAAIQHYIDSAAHAQPVSEPALPVNWAAMIHYPDCWDTAAYPELRDAIHEALAWSGCSVCKPSAPTGEGA